MSERFSGFYLMALAGVLALVLGLAGGYLYVLSSDLMILALAVLAFGMLLGILRPRHSWLPALLLAAGAPMPAVMARPHGPPSDASPIASVIVAGIASSFMGAYAGAAARRMIAHVFSRN